MATVGALGAISGAGANAFLRDEERTRNELVSGGLDLELCVDESNDGRGCRPVNGRRVDLSIDLDDRSSGHAVITATLPDDGRNNPGYVWFRTNCPEGVCGIEQATDVTVRRGTDCDGRHDIGERVFADASLCEVLNRLGGGRPLQPDPLQPGETICLEIEWDLVDDLCYPDETTVTLEFVAHQARRSNGPQRPWQPRECDVACKSDAECACDEGPAISFVAFCVSDGADLDPTDVEFSWRVDGEGDPVEIEWGSDAELSTVVLYHGSRNGPVFENFPGGSSGTATVGEGGPERPGQRPNSPAPEGETGIKYEYANGTFALEPENESLVVADPATPGVDSTHVVDVPIDATLDGGELTAFAIEYDGDFDLSGATDVRVLAGANAAVVDGVTADSGELVVAFETGTALSSDEVLSVEYRPVVNPADAGRYDVEATITAGGTSAKTEGTVAVR